MQKIPNTACNICVSYLTCPNRKFVHDSVIFFLSPFITKRNPESLKEILCFGLRWRTFLFLTLASCSLRLFYHDAPSCFWNWLLVCYGQIISYLTCPNRKFIYDSVIYFLLQDKLCILYLQAQPGSLELDLCFWLLWHFVLVLWYWNNVISVRTLFCFCFNVMYGHSFLNDAGNKKKKRTIWAPSPIVISNAE